MNILSNQRDIDYPQRPVKLAGILLQGSIAYLSSVSQTTFLHMSSPPFIKTDWSAKSLFEKYNLMLGVLNASQKGLMFPQNPKAYSQYILSQFGEKSYRQMEKGGKYCSITLNENESILEFQPNKYKNNGFEGVGEVIKISAIANQEEIILCLERALTQCE